MPRYTVRIAAHGRQGPSLVEVEAATPWLAVEESRKKLGWQVADLYQDNVHLALRPQGVWQVNAVARRT